MHLENGRVRTISGDGAVTISGSLRAPAVTVSNRHLHLECDVHTGMMKLESTTLTLRTKQVVDGVLTLDSGVDLAVNLNRPPAQKTLILIADRITGEFTNTGLKMNERDYRITVDGGRVFIAPKHMTQLQIEVRNNDKKIQ